MSLASFTKIPECWICSSARLKPVHQSRFNLTEFAASDPELLLYHNVHFTLKRCCDCGFMQPDALPNISGFFDRLYAPYHDMQLHTEATADVSNSASMMSRDFDQGSKDFIFRRVLQGLKYAHGLPRRRLLDVGSHVGRMLFLAGEMGWIAEGWEVNPKTAEFARQRTRTKVTNAPVAELARIATDRFEAVTIIDVLEHIPNPLTVLQDIFSITVPGGRIAVKVPCGSGQLLKEWIKSQVRSSYEYTIARNMYHVNHFTPRSLRIALERVGFRDVQFAASPPELFRPESLNGVIRTLPSNALRTSHYWICRLPGVNRIGPLNFHLLAFAKRPQ